MMAGNKREERQRQNGWKIVLIKYDFIIYVIEKHKVMMGSGRSERSREVREFLKLQSKSNICLCIYEL